MLSLSRYHQIIFQSDCSLWALPATQENSDLAETEKLFFFHFTSINTRNFDGIHVSTHSFIHRLLMTSSEHHGLGWVWS